MLDQLVRDLVHSARALWRNAGFTTVVVLTLALGIGANTAIFSVVNAVLLRPLPYPNGARTIVLWTDNPALNLGLPLVPPTDWDVVQWKTQLASVEQVAAFVSRPSDVLIGREPQRAAGVATMAELFPLLGVTAQRGRTFTADDANPGHEKVVLVSDRFWLQRLGGKLDIVGSTLRVNGELHTIVGVMPPGFDFPHGGELPAGFGFGSRTDLWLPLVQDAAAWQIRDSRNLVTLGLLTRGVSQASAEAELDAWAAREALAHPDTHNGWRIRVVPLSHHSAGGTESALVALLAAFGLVLTIASANVAGLLLARAASRRREMAVRIALGASRGRLIRQTVTEGLLVASVGGVVGVLCAGPVVRAILALSPWDLPRLLDTRLDTSVLAFTILITAVAGIGASLFAARAGAVRNAALALRESNRTGAHPATQRLRRMFVIGQIALAVIVLAGAGLMMRSLGKLLELGTGLNPTNVLAMDVQLPVTRYPGAAQQVQFVDRLCERFGEVPGVESAAVISELPLSGRENNGSFSIDGQLASQDAQRPVSERRHVSPGYFGMMGVPIQRGRDFSALDRASQPPVAIVNQALVDRFLPRTNPLGMRIKRGSSPSTPWMTIVGIVSNVKNQSLELDARPQIYVPIAQSPTRAFTLALRASGQIDELAARAQATVNQLDVELPVANVRTMADVLDRAVARPRFGAMLAGSIALVALALASVGMYGVIAFGVQQRTREIGVRMALGARPGDVLRLIVGDGAKLAGAGVTIGVGGAWGLTRLLRTLLFGVSPTDPLTFIAIPLLLMFVAAAACWIPARRAMRLDPVLALRAE